MTHGDDDLADQPIVDQRDADFTCRQRLAIDFNLDYSVLHVTRVFDGDFVHGATVAIVDLELAPCFRDRWID